MRRTGIGRKLALAAQIAVLMLLATNPLHMHFVVGQMHLVVLLLLTAAAALLDRALTTGLPTATLERLSYELGDIRTYQLADPERACRHWRSHRVRFRSWAIFGSAGTTALAAGTAAI